MNKSILFTLGVLVVLVAIYWFSGRDVYKSTVPEDETSGLAAFKEIDFDQVSKIALVKGKGDPVELVKGDEAGWVVANRWNYPADEKKVEDILESLRKIGDARAERAGEFAASHENFEVGSRKGVFLRLFDDKGEGLGDLVIGKSAYTPDFRESWIFARFNGEDPTYKLASDIRSKASIYGDKLEPKSYLDKKVFDLAAQGTEEKEIYEVRLVRPEKDDILVERRYRVKEEEKTDEDEADSEEGEEKAEEKKEPEKEEFFVVTAGNETFEVGDSEKWKARSLVDKGKTITVDDAAEPKDLVEYGLDQPQLKAIVSYRNKDDEPGASRRTITLAFGNAYKDEKGEDEGYYLMLEGAGVDGRIYQIGKWQFDAWNKKLEDFLPKPKEEEKTETETPSEPPAPEAGSEAPAAAPESSEAGSEGPAPESGGATAEPGEGEEIAPREGAPSGVEEGDQAAPKPDAAGAEKVDEAPPPAAGEGDAPGEEPSRP